MDDGKRARRGSQGGVVGGQGEAEALGEFELAVIDEADLEGTADGLTFGYGDSGGGEGVIGAVGRVGPGPCCGSGGDGDGGAALGGRCVP